MYPHYDTPAETAVAYTAGLLDAVGTIAVDGTEVTITRPATPEGADTVERFADVWKVGKTRTEGEWCAWTVVHPRAVEHLLTLCLPFMGEQAQRATEARERAQAIDSQGLTWTPGEERWLLHHWHHSNAQIAEALGRTENAIPHRRRALRPDARPARAPRGFSLDRILISPQGYAHVPGGCVHYVDDPAAAGWGWIPFPPMRVWSEVSADRPARATAGNMARTASRRCPDCAVFLAP